MKTENFLQTFKLVNTNLFNQPIDRAFNSIGSNIFLEFGQSKEVFFQNGKKSFQREWVIWVSLASWRIAKDNKYIVGSGDSAERIQANLQTLLGKRFKSFQIISQFLDAEFNFENGYVLTIFFNWIEEDQWAIFLPDNRGITIDCSSKAAIKNVQNTASHFQIIEAYEKLSTPLQEGIINAITYNEHNLPAFHFEGNFSLNLKICAWRLEKNSTYLIGCLDNDLKKINSELIQLIGKRLKQVNIANSMMDAKFQFEDGFVLKTFTCCHVGEQWEICEQNKVIFSADIAFI